MLSVQGSELLMMCQRDANQFQLAQCSIMIIIIIIIIEICKVPTLQLKALNKHTHIMYIEMENFIQKKKKLNCHSVQFKTRDKTRQGVLSLTVLWKKSIHIHVLLSTLPNCC